MERRLARYLIALTACRRGIAPNDASPWGHESQTESQQQEGSRLGHADAETARDDRETEPVRTVHVQDVRLPGQTTRQHGAGEVDTKTQDKGQAPA